MEVGYETTTLDPFGYTCSTAKNCVMTKVLTQKGKTLMSSLITDQNKNQICFISEFDDNDENC